MIALVGQSIVDRIKVPGRPWVERLGGAPIFGARALVAAGSRPVVLTRGATARLRRPLHDLGLQVVEGPAGASCVSEMVLARDGSRLERFARFGTPFTPADVSGWMAPGLRQARAVVCGAQWEDDFAPETLAALAATGRAVYLDGQGPLRARRLGTLELSGALSPAVTRHLTVLKLAEEEAEAAFHGLDVRAVRALAVPVVVVTLGHRGAVVITGERVVEVDVRPVLGLADTVGAGDAFLALMAAARARGAPLVEATRAACDGSAAMLRERLGDQGRGGQRAHRCTARTSTWRAVPPLRGPAEAEMSAGVAIPETGAVLFDFGGTLDAAGVTWRERAFRLCQAEGLVSSQEQFDPVFFAVDDGLVGRLPETLSLRDTVARLMTGVTGAFGGGTDAVATRLATRFLDDALRALRGQVPLLGELSRRYRLGVVSNFYGNLVTVCGDAEIAEFFSVIVDSARAGYAKPDPRIFQLALDALGVEAARAVFVGDSLDRDMAGARGAGIRHIWLTPGPAPGARACCPGDPLIRSTEQLRELLL